MYGGAAGGGKTYFECAEAYALSAYQPGNRIIMLRKIADHFRLTTLVTWKKIVPPSLATIKEQKKEIIVHTGKEPSTIIYGGFDSREDVSKFGSLEVSSVIIDQAEEVAEDEFNLVASRRGRWKLPNGRLPFGRIILSANPRNCWVKRRFIDAPDPGYKFIKALIKDNPMISPTYESDLRKIFKNRPDIVKALIEGSWDDFEGFSNVIQGKWAKYMFTNQNVTPGEKRVVACDVARGGDDQNVIYGFRGFRQTDEDIFGGDKRTYETAARCLAMANTIDANTIAIGAAGVGAGVADEAEKLCKNTGIKVLRFIESSASDQPDRYYNTRAEAYWEGGKLMADMQVAAKFDAELFDDLTTAEWENRGGRILIEDKKDIKKRLGRSPDKGDAFLIGLWALARAKRVEDYKANTSTAKWVQDAKKRLSGRKQGYDSQEE